MKQIWDVNEVTRTLIQHNNTAFLLKSIYINSVYWPIYTVVVCYINDAYINTISTFLPFQLTIL